MAGIDIGQIGGLLQAAFSTEGGLRRLLENMMKRLKKRTRVVCVFPSRSSCDRLIGAQLLELHEQ